MMLISMKYVTIHQSDAVALVWQDLLDLAWHPFSIGIKLCPNIVTNTVLRWYGHFRSHAII